MSKSKHIHKYKRIKYKSGFTIFRCMLIDCTHFIRAELILNRKSICWRCDSSFIMRRIDIVKPHCEECTRGEKKKNRFGENAIDTLLNVIGG